ncbi:hypothetical protein ANO11243_048800 [Dothideomycetidae sp. 11243]|nr:hypothetical protein ANO11243_048800 [fungal sp. No.11243]
MDSTTRAAELVKQLNDPRYASSANSISRQLLALQLSPEGWAIADSLLTSNDYDLQFYGALSFQVKLNRDAASTLPLSQHDADAVLSRLIAAFCANVRNAGPMRVLDKICSVLATYFVQTPAPWNHAVETIVALLLSGQNISASSLAAAHSFDLESLRSLSDQHLRAVLRLCKFLAEDLVLFEGKTVKHHHVEEAFKTCVPAFGTLLQVVLLQHRKSSQELSEEALSAYTAWSLYAISHWQYDLDTWKTLQGMTDMVLQLLVHDDPMLMLLAADALSEVLSQESKLLTKAQMSEMWPMIDLAQQRSSAIDSEDRISLLKLLVAWSKTMIPEMGGRPDLPTFRSALTQLTQVLFGVDWVEDGCGQLVIVNEFWIQLADHLVEYGVDMDEGHKHQFSSILDSVIEAYFDVLDRKDDSTMAQADSDYIDGWHRCREDFTEIMNSLMEVDFISVYGVCADQIEQALARQDWYRLESVLSLLNDLALYYDSMPASEQGLSRIFASELFGQIIQPDALLHLSTRLEALLVRFIDNYSAYLRQVPTQIPSMMTLLMSMVEQNVSRESKLADLAAKGIASICSSCRKVLLPMAADLLSFCERALASDDLTSYQRDKIYSGMAFVIQALPNEREKISPITLLLSKLHQDLLNARLLLDHGQAELAEQKIVTDLQCLAAIGKALHSGDRHVTIEDDDDAPATNGHAESPWASEEGRSIPAQVVECLRFVEVIPSSGDAWEGVCSVLRIGLSEMEPGPFVFPSSLVSRFLSSMTPSSPRLEALITTACAFVSAHSRATHSRVPSEVSHIAPPVVAVLLSLGAPQSDPGLAQLCTEFLDRLIPRYTDVLLAIPALEAVLQFQLQCLTSDAPMLKRVVASFLSSLLAQGTDHSVPAAAQLVSHLQAPIAAALIHQIGGHAQRSELDAIAKVLRSLLQIGPTAKLALEHALYGEAWPATAQASDAEKRAFVQRIVMLRGGRGTAEAVKEFWAKARGTVGRF